MADLAKDRIAGALARYRVHAARFDAVAARRGPDPVTQPVLAAASPALSGREIEVIRLAGAGCTTEETATALVLTEHTVKSHFKRIQAKLGARNRTHAVALALRGGLID